VTSFNKRLYDATGYRLLKTHRHYEIKEPLLITYEGISQKDIITNDKFIYFNFDNYTYLGEWLENYKNIIPTDLGGNAPPCKCKIVTRKDMWGSHEFGCAHSEWNRRASQWFRKIAALNYALTLNPEKIVFLDCDVMFLRNLPIKLWQGIFANFGIIYHQGKYRQRTGNGVESGIIGFSQKGGGFEFLERVINYFNVGAFKQQKRWDDSYAFRLVLEKTPKHKMLRRDLVTIGRRTSHVVNLGLLKDYLRHDKGWHLRHFKIV